MYEILNDTGEVINRIVASQEFVEITYPGKWRCVAEAVGTAPKPLNQLQFIELCQTAGGMTDEQLVACKADAILAAMWIKLGAAVEIARDDSRTQQGLAALAALGYLPNGAQAVNDGWPTE